MTRSEKRGKEEFFPSFTVTFIYAKSLYKDFHVKEGKKGSFSLFCIFLIDLTPISGPFGGDTHPYGAVELSYTQIGIANPTVQHLRIEYVTNSFLVAFLMLKKV